MCFREIKRSYITLLGSLLLVLSGVFFSLADAATNAGTLIRPATLAMQYSDGAAISVNTSTTIGMTTEVLPIYGAIVTPMTQVTASLAMGETVYFQQVVGNAGNTTDNMTYVLSGLTAGWAAVLYQDSNNNGVHEAGELITVTSPIRMGPEATASVFVALTAPATYITPGTVRFAVSTSGTPAGVYTGFNNVVYGAPALQSVTENAQLTDTVLPVVTPLSPTAGAQQVPIDSFVAFDVIDLESGISLNTLRVTVNGSSYAPTAMSAITNGYRVSVDPADLPYATTINVEVRIGDSIGNERYVTYAFKTKAQSTALFLTAYLHGYMNTATRVHRSATINIQLRPTRNIDSGPSINADLSASGNTGVVGINTPAGAYYLVIRQVLSGAVLGVNHVAYVSSESISILSEQVTTINLATANSAYYARPFIPRSGYSPLLLENGMLLIKGGEATGERVINVTDIIRWNNAATNANADTRGKSAWSEDPNFDGDPYMNTDDFSVWNKNKGQSVPLPEED